MSRTLRSRAKDDISPPKYVVVYLSLFFFPIICSYRSGRLVGSFSSPHFHLLYYPALTASLPHGHQPAFSSRALPLGPEPLGLPNFELILGMPTCGFSLSLLQQFTLPRNSEIPSLMMRNEDLHVILCVFFFTNAFSRTAASPPPSEICQLPPNRCGRRLA